LVTDARSQYERWMRRKPTFWLAIAGFAVVFGLQIAVRSSGAGATQALGRGVVVTLLVGIMGAVFLHLIERDLRSRIDAPPLTAGLVSTATLMVRPTPWKGWYYLVLPAIVVGVAVAFVWAAAGDNSASAYAAWGCFIFSLLFTVVFVGGAWLFVHNSQLELIGDSIVKTNWRRARTTVSRGDIARVLRLAVDRSGASRSGSYITRYWIFGSTRDKALLIINGAMWPIGDIEILVGRLGVPVEGSWNDVLKPKEVRRRVKGVVSWTSAHPWVVLIATVVLSLALVVVGISLADSWR
jgi:hypothetical protein